jgi:methionyl aminopeptidase
MIIGKPTSAQKHLLSYTESSLYEGIAQVKAGAKLGDIGAAVEKVLEKGKLGVIRNYVGHGIGKKMHMEPEVPNSGKKGHGYELKAGDTICIEPMSSLGKPDTVVVEDDDDGWTVCLRDGSLGCHFEHTILVTEDGYEILTQA